MWVKSFSMLFINPTFRFLLSKWRLFDSIGITLSTQLISGQ
jgi:hypothetical protein